MKNHSLIILVLLAAFSACSQKPSSPIGLEAEYPTKPNLVFILADQWRAEATGYAGNPDVITPNLDRLASESLIFENAVTVMAVCAPWRASFLTGQYPLTHGIFYNDKPLDSEAITLGKIYKEAGYQTGYIGKWHLNGHQRGEDPFSGRNQPVPKERRQGFDYWKVREVTHDYNNSFYFDENDQKQFWTGYDAFAQTDSAISYIQRNKENPFVLVMSWGPPHDPYPTAPQEFKDRYDWRKIKLRPNVPLALQDSAKRVIANYYAHITALDSALGRLLDEIDNAGLAENTIFVFTSEHGDMLLSKGVLKKQRPYDESIKVPMLIRFPSKFGKSSRNISNPINTPDLLPTLLGLSGIAIPETVEGKDFSNSLISGKEIVSEAALIMLPVPFHEWQFKNGGREFRGIRTRRYTYVKDLKGPWLLYDNEKDPYQMDNLIGRTDFNTLESSMETILMKKLAERNDEFLPADEYMTQWNYLYDRTDSIRPANYLEINR
ncbi:sulfatase family protein [Algoriphagus marinus]|uniref:sulfatase family protein n=1 Tax=Algoriphagus marinus TaxID=1925762 RepID=UPI00094BA4DF|nr:sulfatase [Algoriphagus marinus]